MGPAVLKEDDPNFASVFLTNLGSIQCPSVYHHLNNYGTNSIMIAIGTMHKVEKIAADGTYVTGIINRSAICARVGRKGKIIDKIAVKIADCAVRRIMDGTTVCIGVVT